MVRLNDFIKYNQSTKVEKENIRKNKEYLR
nr:MAG TPA: hypothetical protein [Caudoviricetes sp.]